MNLNNHLRYFIGDIRDYDRLEIALKKVDVVFHACALKRIQECEYNPMEAIKTNILGTNNLIMASIKNNVSYVIGLSTDKACSPVNLYGSTKLCAEKLLINGNILSGGLTKFAVCRYGNIMASRGSLFQIFKQQLADNKKLTVTDPSMTRFNMLQIEAVNFVLMCYNLMIGGEIFIPKLPSYSIAQVLRCLNVDETQISIIGCRAGEKYHEIMISEDESHLAYELDDFFIMTPLEEHGLQHFNIDHYKNKQLQLTKVPSRIAYSSKNATPLTDEKLCLLIKNFQ
jgi:UDP-N-acetylglucosamine 4,6-dehydratase/5-epimerase